VIRANNTDLTIILVLKGRDDFTFRWFEYAKKINFPYKIIVADGGDNSDLENKLSEKEYYMYVNYKYIKYPFDKTYKIYYSKILKSLLKVETPYVLLASNDDFYFLDAIVKSLDFLKKNSDYVSARGEIWDFSVFPNSFFKDKSPIYGNIFGISKLYHHPTVMGNNAMERVIDFTKKSNSMWHDIVKTEHLKEAYEDLVKSNIYDFALYETTINYSLATKGKIKREKGLFMLHQCHSNMAALKDLYSSPLEWINSPGWKKDFNKFLDLVASKISKEDKINFYESKYKLNEAYFNLTLINKLKSFTSPGTKDLRNKIDLFVFIKKLLSKNHSIFKASKLIYNIFFKPNKYDNKIPTTFFSKINAIENFLKQ